MQVPLEHRLQEPGDCFNWTVWILIEFSHNLSFLIIFPPLSSLLLLVGFCLFAFQSCDRRMCWTKFFYQLVPGVVCPEELCNPQNASVCLLPLQPSAEPASLPAATEMVLGERALAQCGQQLLPGRSGPSRPALSVPRLAESSGVFKDRLR